jgi:hypothetical protein
MSRNTLIAVLISAGMVLQVSPAPLRAFTLATASLTRVPLPAGTSVVYPATSADMDGNGMLETFRLVDDQAAILSEGQIAWQSPAAWIVIQAAFANLNHDDLPELVLLVWRPFNPWPVDRWLPHGGRIADFQDGNGDSCHIILIGWNGRDYDELWAGSALANPITSLAAADLNEDTTQELVTLESSYQKGRSSPARILKVWEWNGFGFSAVSSIDGVFEKMAIVRDDDGRTLILIP